MPKSQFKKDFGMYSLLIHSFSDDCQNLASQIEIELNNLDSDSISENLINDVSTATDKYLAHIDLIIDELTKNAVDSDGDIFSSQEKLMSALEVNDYFFNGNDISEKGDKFKRTIDNYREEIKSLHEFPKYTEGLLSKLSTSELTYRDGSKIDILDYHFRDTPLVATLVYLNSMKRDALEFNRLIILKTSCQQRINANAHKAMVVEKKI